MASRSYSNLMELAGGADRDQPLPSLGQPRIPRVMTASGIVPGLDRADAAADADAYAASVASDDQSDQPPRERTIIVANQLPIRACRGADGAWEFSWDQDSLLRQLKESLPAHQGRAHMDFVYIGGLRDDIPAEDQDKVALELYERFRCVPAFLPDDLRSRFYHGFCKQQLWPLFHYMLPLSPELIKEFRDRGRIMMLGVDDMDIFKGISLKLLAFEELLTQHPEYRGKVVLVQIANPARGKGKDVKEVQDESYAMVKRINEAFGQPDYQPVILIDRPLHFYERMAYYVVAECCLVTAVRDGMNLIPYEYIIARQGNEKIDRILGLSPFTRKKSMLVVSEFIGCSPSLSGAIRVNPWNIESVAEAMDKALHTGEGEQVLRHEKHHKFVSTHDVGYWANSFLQDLARTCQDHNKRRCWGIGFGLRFRCVALDTSFKKLAVEQLVYAYRKASTRAILLDYDGTLMPESSFGKMPSSKTINMLNSLCRDEKNLVLITSTKTRATLSEWFSACEDLGLAAEHGYFIRLERDAEWETCGLATDFSWKQIAEPVMKTYTETTDGSIIEDKETAIVWCYKDADRDFGSCQAKELHDHLESVLSNEPVSVKADLNYVEVKPQGVSKGLVAKRMLSTMQELGLPPDFVLCVGDDRSDEDMFEVITTAVDGPYLSPGATVFACTVGQKPSKAKYYLDEPADIKRMIRALARVSDQELAMEEGEDPPYPFLAGDDTSTDDTWLN
ncbi:unnamed protein product [Triticum turgidum subsp. durum]|uniref:Trehalose 6-phosphate phosphatase n=1 Tax=Triticum turgidum subsp. durum TaxID=4567 RepID=A0A9R0X8V1_TRITD|nr:unnamed protein product [Triticum turgidum subsp. durum]